MRVRVVPNAGRDRIEGIETLADGASVLKIRVAAVPDKGRANRSVVLLLAKALGVPRSAITVAAGETARLKTLAISGDPALLARALDTLYALPSD